MWVFLTVLVAVLGGSLLLKLKFPGGMLVGAILGVVILNVATGQAYMYTVARLAAQCITGAYLGCMLTRERVAQMPQVIKPYLVVVSSLLILNLCVGTFFHRITDYDLLTCLFCAAPSGISDTPLVAMDMGADASVVAVMQFVRIMFGLGCLPSMILLTDRLLEPEVSHEMDEKAKGLEQKARQKANASAVRFVPVLVVAFLAGLIGRWSGLPAGALAASLLVVGALNILGKVPPMPGWMRRVAQVLSGCCIGATVTLDQLIQMRQLIVPAVVLCLGYSVCCFGVGLVVAKTFHLSLREAMLSLSPAGVSEMALIAAELGVESTNLVVLQIGRLVGATVVFPHIFRLVVALAG